MAKAGNTKTTAQKAQTPAPTRGRQKAHGPDPGGMSEAVLDLQRTAGNHAVSELLTRAAQESSQQLDESVRVPMEQALGANLSGVRVHSGASSQAAAESIGARAYTIGSDIHLGSDAQHLNTAQRNQLLAHEAVHSIQQGGRPIALQGKLPVSRPGDSAESEADLIAESIVSHGSASSPALAMRGALRVTASPPAIARDIKGKKTTGAGKFEIDFTSTDGAAVGDRANEDGKITFTPAKTAPKSTSIGFIQIVRIIDTAGTTGTAGDNVDWSKVDTGGEAPRNQMLTTANAKKNVAGGFFVDQIAAALAKRTKKADPAVSPFYDESGGPIPAGTVRGTNDGKTPTAAVLTDVPGFNIPVRFSFVTSAKAGDTGTYYGTVLWGFETFHDKKGITRIKNEYHSFRAIRGETTDAAIKKYNEFYQNPGTAGAPTK